MRHVAPISLPFSAACAHFPSPTGVSPLRPSFQESLPLCVSVPLWPACRRQANPIVSAVCRLLFSLASLFRTRILCLQQLADSFDKNRGVGGPIMVNHALSGRPAGIASLDRHANGGTPALLWKDELFGSERTILDVVHLDLILFTALKSLPTLETTWRQLACGKIAGIFGWSTARTIGSTFGRIYFSGTESHSPRQTPSPRVRRSIPVSGPAAMSAAKSMSISPRKFSAASKSLLSPSRHIRYSARKEPEPIQLSRKRHAKKIEAVLTDCSSGIYRWKPLTFSQGSGAFRRRGTTLGWGQALAMVVRDLFLAGKLTAPDTRLGRTGRN